MQLERCSDQPSRSLDGFYAEHARSDHDGTRDIGRAMCSLIARLRALPDERRVYGLTSHYRLCLLAEDTSASPWYVIFVAVDSRVFVEYLMSVHDAPWPRACVRGEASSEDEAVAMILTAMDRSGGWNTGGDS